MQKLRHPLGRSITIMCSIFIAILVIVLSIVSYIFNTRSMLHLYQEQMVSIANYIESQIDNDDMAQCTQTWTESPKYKETRLIFDNFIDTYTNLHYLYIIKPMEPGNPIKVRSILSANSTYEKEYEPESVLYIGDGEEDWYDEETTQTLREILVGNQDVFFIDKTDWGTDYTLARPLVDSNGTHYGLLCLDISIEEIQTTINRNIIYNIFFIVLLGVIFIVAFLVWSGVNVTHPITSLENSVVKFANSSHGKRNPDELVFTPPVIDTGNEVESLGVAVTKLSEDMRDYVKDILSAEGEANELRSNVFKDALTNVKNKAAYDEKVKELNIEIQNKSANFAIIMIDFNNLKTINDFYGHDKGNEYIKGGCNIICDVYPLSPVYRIGGDEFVAILEGSEFNIRNELLAKANKQFEICYSNKSLEPWQRYSAAIGMAIYDNEKDSDVDMVFKRADSNMYEAKVRMKKKMGQ